MNNTFIGPLDLLKLRNSKITEVDGEEGIFIPFRNKGVKKLEYKNTQAILNIFCLPKQDEWGNSHMVTRMRTKEESSANTYTEILGNLMELKKGTKYGRRQSNNEPQPQKPPTPDAEMSGGEDDPF